MPNVQLKLKTKLKVFSLYTLKYVNTIEFKIRIHYKAMIILSNSNRPSFIAL